MARAMLNSVRYGLCILVVTLGIGSVAHGEPFRIGPYLQNVSKHSITIMWESDRERAGRVEVLGESGQTIVSEPQEMHEIVIGNLQPGKRYRYRAYCGDSHRDGEFATAPEDNAPFSFVVFGDTRSRLAPHRRVAERIRREFADFIVGTGDMVNDGSKENEWQEFFQIESSLLRESVLFPSVGNHDRQGRGRTADNYRRYFSLPENSPDPERYYAVTYGNARFLVLDSNAYSFALTDQTAWIERQLQSARLDKSIRHIFVTMHHPPFSVSLHGGQKQLRQAWTPLFERYGVAAVFSGHDHVYSRAENNGVRYFVTGGGGAPLYPRSRRASLVDKKAVRYFERIHHYLRVFVTGAFVQVTAIRSDGSMIETIRWGTEPELPAPPIAVRQEPRPLPNPAIGAPPAIAGVGARSIASSGILGIVGLGLMAAAAMMLFWVVRR